MKYPINKDNWMEVFKENIGFECTEAEREIGEKYVDSLNTAYMQGFNDGKMTVLK